MNKIEEIKYKDYTTKINLSRGANCVGLRKGDYKILREPDYTKELDNPYLYGMPILFPVNRISGGFFEFEGRIYDFGINEKNTNCHLHGTIHEKEFEIIKKSTNKIVCSYKPDKNDTYVKNNQNYKIDIEYILDDKGFYQCTTITNLSDMNMPVMLGFHTTFNTLFANSDKEDIFVYAGISEEYERNMDNYLPTGEILAFDDVSNALLTGSFKPFDEPISRHYKALPQGKMIIYDKCKNLSMIYENDEKYQYRLIFNRGEYICLEPQNCMANCQNSPFGREKTGFDYLEPGRMKSYYSRISIIEGCIVNDPLKAF